MKKFVKIAFGILLLFVIAFYLCVVYLLPSIINSKTAINKIQSLIFNKTKIETKITGLNLKVSPKLIFKLNVDSIDAKYNNTSVLDIKNHFSSRTVISHCFCCIDYCYFKFKQ